ncbi:MAG: glycosyltransferase family 4 protein, partial [Candidatus Eremiobacteraeota bacterium]|nr:glycosyltransferase family 4 protein [Candidatus Eremiobacteraeota bacterium]
ALHLLADSLYRYASLILVVTEPCRQQILARGIAPAKVLLAPNGFDRVEPAREPQFLRAPGQFVIACVGTMGFMQGVDVVLSAASCLRQDRRFKFVLAGGGTDLEKVMARVAEEHLENVEVLGPKSRAEAFALQAQADVCVVPLRNAAPDSLPTKMFDALALKKPVIACAVGEAARFINESGGGVVVEPENGPALANAIRYLADEDPARLADYGRSGSEYVMAHFDRAALTPKITARIVGAAPA